MVNATGKLKPGGRPTPISKGSRRVRAGDRLREFLLDSVRRGLLQPGDMTPGQAELARRFRIGEVTVRRTLAELQEEGLVRREQGRGTMITPEAYEIAHPQSSSGHVLLALRTNGHFFAELLQKLVRNMDNKTHIPAVLGLDRADGKFHPPDHLASLLQNAVRDDYVAAIFEWSDYDDRDTWTTFHEAAQVLHRRGIPVLWLLAATEELPAPFETDLVSVDYRAGIAQATQHLIDDGHQRIAFLAPHSSGRRISATSHVTPFLDGYKRTMRFAGLDQHRQIMECPALEEHERYAEEVLRDPKRPSAVVACQDFPLISFVKVARKLGLRIPQDLALVGFGNTPWATTYELSSLDPCLDLLARRVHGWLNDRPTRDLGHAVTLIQPRLVVRRSSSTAPEDRDGQGVAVQVDADTEPDTNRLSETNHD